MSHKPFLAALLAAALSGQALAQDLPVAEGEVRRVDSKAGKITLRHGDIKNLDMPPMTMVFQVKDAAWLGQVKAGDRVRFTADKIDGNYTVLSLQPAGASASNSAVPAATPSSAPVPEKDAGHSGGTHKH